LIGESEFTYTSPVAMDVEEQQPVILVEWPTVPSFARVLISRNFFSLTFDLKQVRRSNLYSIKVRVGDELWGPEKYDGKEVVVRVDYQVKVETVRGEQDEEV